MVGRSPSTNSVSGFDPANAWIPSLDGVRAMAIILVVMVHAFYRGPDLDLGPIAKNVLIFGWTGVDLFFVLSGFLITSILLDMKGKPSPFRNFYVKRIARIFPLYYAILIIFPLTILIDHPKVTPQTQNYIDNYILYFTFTSNLSDVLGIKLNNPLGPAWSLALEEQYYLVWPMAVLWLRTNVLRLLAPGLLVGFAVLRFYLVGTLSPDAIYHFTLTHADGILTGSCMALYRDDLARFKRYWPLPLAVLAAILLAVFLVAQTTHYQNPMVQKFAFLPIALFYGAFTFAAMASTRLASVLAWPPLVHVGRYSFFIYLTHIPLLLVLDQFALPGGLVGWFVFTLTFTVAITVVGHLSWIWFERPVSKAIRKRWLVRHDRQGILSNVAT